MKIDLSGKVSLVTGASRGIGRTIALKLAEAGSTVAFTYKSSDDKALAVQKELEAFGGKALAIKSDAAVFQDAQAAVDKVVNTFGALNILVNNAGITKDTLIMRMSEADWDAVLDANLKSVFNFTKAAAKPMMSKREGRIINITSIVGLIGQAGQSNYAASKAGMIGFTKSMAKELASRNILINAVAPGWIATEMTEKLTDEQIKNFADNIPLKRSGTAEEVANAVLFLASDLATYLTGETIRVDGGLAM